MPHQTSPEKRVHCPACDHKSKQVSPITLRALLLPEYANEFCSDEQSCCGFDDNGDPGCQPIAGDTGWRFCDSQDCDIVYFSEEGGTEFSKSQLKVSVGVKETDGERPLCYCFGHSVASIKDDLQTKGQSEALSDIRERMKNPGCRCETENPSGSCCLGSVTKGIKLAKKEIGIDDTDNPTLPTPPKSSSSKGEKIAQIGTLISAIMASSCCWLPLLLLAVGVSGAGIASTLEAYRPLFMVVTFGFLGAAFYFTYRPKKTVADGKNDCCTTKVTNSEDCCGPVAKGRFSMLTLNKLMLWGVTVMAVAFLFFPSYIGFILAGISQGDVAISSHNSLIRQTVIDVEGMHCEGCAIGLEQAVKVVPGVLAVKVDYENKQTIISTETCCAFPEATVLKAIQDAGFTGTVHISDENK